jgi:hypothetical protein
VQFDSRLDKDGFKIIKIRPHQLQQAKRQFCRYPICKRQSHAATYYWSRKTPATPRLEQISPDLRNAVMTAEDPTFYTNNGFVEESIRKSIATDYIQHKFKRGGSTISMQLVKNAFLSQKKTLTRKIEEMLIVWLLVNNHITTKSRMLEVYFNMIEWGNNVYGIGEAAHYYFGKSPSELTLGESIYLASIVPKAPVGPVRLFTRRFTLNPRLSYYFNIIGNLMEGHGLTAHRDSSVYGLYTQLALKRKPAPADQPIGYIGLYPINESRRDDDDNEAAVTPVIAPPPPEPEKKPNFFQRLFGGGKKKDTTQKRRAQD